MTPFLHFPLPLLQSWAANYISIAGWQGVYKWTILDLSLSTFFVPSFPKLAIISPSLVGKLYKCTFLDAG